MPRAGLSKDAVVDLALTVVDEEGFARLTLAAVASRAGVAVPSLYKHVAGLPDLRREVALRCVEEFAAHLREVGAGAPAAEPQTRVRALAHAVRGFALAHPGRYTAVQGGSWARDPEATAVQLAAGRAVALLAEALGRLGLPDQDTIDAVRAVRALVHGFVTLELDGGFGLPDDVSASFARAVDAMVAGLTPEE